MKIETVIGAFIASLIGFLTGMLAIFQQDATVTLSSVSQSAWLVLGVGALIAFLKDYQAISFRKLVAPTGGNKLGSPLIVGVLAILIATTLTVGGCSGTRGAYKAADGIEDQAKVVAEHYYALVKEANLMKKSGELSGSALAKTQDLVRTTRPLVIELANTAQIYEAVRSADNERALDAALVKAAIAVSKLIDLVKGKDQTSKTEVSPAFIPLAA